MVPSFPHCNVGTFQAEENRICMPRPGLPVSHQDKSGSQLTKPFDSFLDTMCCTLLVFGIDQEDPAPLLATPTHQKMWPVTLFAAFWSFLFLQICTFPPPALCLFLKVVIKWWLINSKWLFHMADCILKLQVSSDSVSTNFFWFFFFFNFWQSGI